jgi:hypothetical protein
MGNQVTNITQCKVCNSKFRNLIEQLHTNSLSPEKIYQYLQNMQDPKDKAQIKKEDIKPSSIRRHMQNHFSSEEGSKVKLAETKARIEQSRNLLQQGIQITVDKINSLNHLIETSLIRLEEVEHIASESKKHQYTIQYMNTIKGLIESLSKLTGELRQEGTIDINFFNNEIAGFAEIVLQTIRIVDKQLEMEGKLEILFAQEFTKQWQQMQERQEKIISGELGASSRPNNQNNFNDSSF